MRRFIKLAIVVVVVGVIAVAAVAAYVFAVVAGPLQGKAVAASPEDVAQAAEVEQRIEEAVSENSAFFVQLTSEDLTALLRAEAGDVAAVRDLKVTVNQDDIVISGDLNGTVPVPFSANVGVALVRGIVEISVDRVSMGLAPLPGTARSELQPLLDEVVNVNELLSSAGAVQIQRIDLSPGVFTVSGIQSGDNVVTDATAAVLNEAFTSSGGKPTPVPLGDDVVPPGRTGNEAGGDLYLALGDSLAANVGVASATEGYVSRFHSHIERETGRTLGLMNLGVSGESSLSIYGNQLTLALAELDRLRNDGDPATRISVLSIDIGANDLLGHLGSSACRDDIRSEVCTERLDAAVTDFSANIADILGELSSRLDEDAEFYVMTVFNPFDFGIGIPFESDSNEVITLMNEIIRVQADRFGATVADAYGAMSGNAAAWTHMLEGDVHPTAEGYQAIAYAFAQARAGR